MVCQDKKHRNNFLEKTLKATAQQTETKYDLRHKC
jgi:hypothetical protein